MRGRIILLGFCGIGVFKVEGTSSILGRKCWRDPSSIINLDGWVLFYFTCLRRFGECTLVGSTLVPSYLESIDLMF